MASLRAGALLATDACFMGWDGTDLLVLTHPSLERGGHRKGTAVTHYLQSYKD